MAHKQMIGKNVLVVSGNPETVHVLMKTSEKTLCGIAKADTKIYSPQRILQPQEVEARRPLCGACFEKLGGNTPPLVSSSFRVNK